jgi:hypothetical protein
MKKIFNILLTILGLNLANTNMAQSAFPKVIQNLFDNLSTEFSSEVSYDGGIGNCHQRSKIWSYQIQIMTGETPKKAVILFTKLSHKNTNRNFDFHVAPTINYNGEDYILERFGQFTDPVTLAQWTKRMNGNNRKCKKLESHLTEKLQAGFVSLNGFKSKYYKAIEDSEEDCYVFIANRNFTHTNCPILDFTPNEGACTKFDGNDALKACMYYYQDQHESTFNLDAGTADEVTKTNIRVKCESFLNETLPRFNIHSK